MVDLSAYSDGVTQIQSLSSLILVKPQFNAGYRAQNDFDGSLDNPIVFTYERENQIQLDSEITDHFVEDNTAIQDQIALKPEILTVGGVVGELSNEPPEGFEGAREVADRLQLLSPYLPELTIAAQRAYNQSEQATRAFQQGQKALNSNLEEAFSPIVDENGIQQVDFTQTKQQVFFQRFYALWRERRLFTVQTPWAIFKNCAIQNLRVIQSEDNAEISDFELTFKVLRFAETRFAPSALQLATRLRAQAAANVNNGSQAGLVVGEFSPTNFF